MGSIVYIVGVVLSVLAVIDIIKKPILTLTMRHPSLVCARVRG